MDKTILLVEDNPDDELLAIRALRKGCLADRVAVARDGAEAINYVFAEGGYGDKTEGPRLQVVFLDLKLPKIDGLEVLRRIRSDERTKLLPVVVLTSSDEERDMMESYSLGANSYVKKPIDFAHFTQTIEQLGKYWLTLNKTPFSEEL
jgi:CheY-like chemotaxis protein